MALASPGARKPPEGVYGLEPSALGVVLAYANLFSPSLSLGLGPRMRDQMEGLERPEPMVSLKVSLSPWILGDVLRHS